MQGRQARVPKSLRSGGGDRRYKKIMSEWRERKGLVEKATVAGVSVSAGEAGRAQRSWQMEQHAKAGTSRCEEGAYTRP